VHIALGVRVDGTNEVPGQEINYLAGIIKRLSRERAISPGI
jgi:hypothetical protein